MNVKYCDLTIKQRIANIFIYSIILFASLAIITIIVDYIVKIVTNLTGGTIHNISRITIVIILVSLVLFGILFVYFVLRTIIRMIKNEIVVKQYVDDNGIHKNGEFVYLYDLNSLNIASIKITRSTKKMLKGLLK